MITFILFILTISFILIINFNFKEIKRLFRKQKNK